MNELVRYGIAGVLNTLVGYLTFWVGLQVFNFSPLIANTLGYAAGLGVAYLLNRIFVFRSAAGGKTSMLRFALAFATAFLINQGVLLLLLRIPGLEAEIAQIPAMITYTVVFFLMNKYFVFKQKTL